MKGRARQNAESGKDDNAAPFYIKVTYILRHSEDIHTHSTRFINSYKY